MKYFSVILLSVCLFSCANTGNQRLISERKSHDSVNKKTGNPQEISSEVNSDTNFSVILNKFDLISKNKMIEFHIVYPQISGIKNNNTIDRINFSLKKNFLISYDYLMDTLPVDLTRPGIIEKIAETFKKEKYGKSYNAEATFEVKSKINKILSIYYTFSGYLKPSAHPGNEIQAFNFDLNTGEIIQFDKLFKKGSEYSKLINDKIFNELKLNDISEDSFNPVETYDFYIEKDKLVIINIFSIHAIQSFEVPIRLSELKGFLNPSYFN